MAPVRDALDVILRGHELAPLSTVTTFGAAIDSTSRS